MAEAGDLSIEIVEGVISTFKAEVLVNSTNRGLQLDIGALSKSFLNGAGQEIQDECVKNYPVDVGLGKIAATDGYKLPCNKADVLVNSTNRGLQLDIGALSKSFLNGAGQEIQDECVKNYPGGVGLGKIAATDGYKLPCNKADVLVNSTNRGLQLDIGALSKSFLSGAGQEIQDECVKNYPGGVGLGKIAATDGYKLPCNKVYHGALPTWDSKEKNVKPQEMLCEFVCACLEQAHADGARSIAFPTLGCGFLNYPHLKVAATMCQCIAIFKSLHEQTSLSNVYVVVYTKGQDWRHIKQAFLQELGLARPDRGGRRPGSRGNNVFSAAKIGAMRNFVPGRRREPRGAEAQKRKHGPSAPLMDTCMREHAHNSCKQVLSCGHVCPGAKGEKSCPPCIQSDCAGRGSLKQSANDDCTVCYTDVLSAAPVIQLSCGHMYHFHCIRRILDNKWVGARITFNFMKCPMCKKEMVHPLLTEKLAPLQAIKDEVRRKALMRLQYEGQDKCHEVRSPDSQYYNKPDEFAMDRYCYYPCFKCKQAYFGGAVQCEQGAADREFEIKDLVCPSCSNPDPQQVCPKHQNQFLEYKCRYCCSVAVFFCFGSTHFCQDCHDDLGRITNMPVRSLPSCPVGPGAKQLKGACPLKVQHPPTGTEFLLGCGLCAHMSTF